MKENKQGACPLRFEQRFLLVKVGLNCSAHVLQGPETRASEPVGCPLALPGQGQQKPEEGGLPNMGFLSPP